MRKKLLVTLALAAMLTGSVAAIASAASTTVRAGNLVLRFGGNVLPKKLPKRRYAPIGLNVFGSIKTTDGSHASAFRQALVYIDKNGRIDTRGIPVCAGGQLQARNTRAAKRVCGRSVVGAGKTNIEIAFPEQKPIDVKAPITVFNGGTRGGKTTLYVHTFLTVPVPAAVVTRIIVQKVKQGRFGYKVLALVPQIAGGSGSVENFNFTIQRKLYRFRGRRHPLLSARCTDGKFVSRLARASFRNESGESGVAPSTTLKGGVVVPCTPTR